MILSDFLSFIVDTLSLFLQCASKELVKVLTKANMTAHHTLVGDLVFEVTVRKVEHILQVNTLPCCGLKVSLPPRNISPSNLAAMGKSQKNI